jgi:hypothetical protein
LTKSVGDTAVKVIIVLDIDGQEWGREVCDLSKGDKLSEKASMLTARFERENAFDPFDPGSDSTLFDRSNIRFLSEYE